MDQTNSFGYIKVEAIVKYKDYKMLTRNQKWLEFFYLQMIQ